MKKEKISVIVPAYNEEKNLEGAADSIERALSGSGRFDDYEIIILDDCSTDSTGLIADRLKRSRKNIRVVHNPRNMGFGFNYTEGVRLAEKEYIIMVPGDNEIPEEAISKVLALAGKADIVIPYTANPEVRPLSRRVVSRAFVILMNTLFGLGLRYYNGTCLIRADLLKGVPMKTHGFAYMAAILVRLLRSGASYVEVGVNIQERSGGRSKAFRPSNIVSVLSAIASLFWEVRVAKRKNYAGRARKVEAAVRAG